MEKTPKKGLESERKCVACGENAKESRALHSAIGKQKNLSQLLERFGGVNIVSGTLCRNCERRMLMINEKCALFYNMCQKTLSVGRFKRLHVVKSPASEETLPKRQCGETHDHADRSRQIRQALGPQKWPSPSKIPVPVGVKRSGVPKSRTEQKSATKSCFSTYKSPDTGLPQHASQIPVAITSPRPMPSGSPLKSTTKQPTVCRTLPFSNTQLQSGTHANQASSRYQSISPPSPLASKIPVAITSPRPMPSGSPLKSTTKQPTVCQTLPFSNTQLQSGTHANQACSRYQSISPPSPLASKIPVAITSPRPMLSGSPLKSTFKQPTVCQTLFFSNTLLQSGTHANQASSRYQSISPPSPLASKIPVAITSPRPMPLGFPLKSIFKQPTVCRTLPFSITQLQLGSHASQASNRSCTKTPPSPLDSRISVPVHQSPDNSKMLVEDALFSLTTDSSPPVACHSSSQPVADNRSNQKAKRSSQLLSPLRDHSYSASNSNLRAHSSKSNPKGNEHRITDSKPAKHRYRKKPKPRGVYHENLTSIVSSATSTCNTPDRLTSSEVHKIRSLSAASVESLVVYMLSIPTLRKTLLRAITKEQDRKAALAGNRKYDRTYLMKKDYQDLKSLNWGAVVQEFKENYPDIFHLVLNLMLTPKQRSSIQKLQTVMPRLGMVYAICMQTRIRELSRIQRIVSMLLMDHICDQKVFDRLHPLGVCINYSTSLRVMEMIGGHFNSELIDLVKKGKRFRLIGDNVNWATGVHDERVSRQRGHMHHAFASAALTQAMDFADRSVSRPQKDCAQVSVMDFIPSKDEIREIRNEYAILIAHTATRLIPAFHHLKKLIPSIKTGEYSDRSMERTKVIPLPILFKNEQYYVQVVDILDFYEKFLADTYRSAKQPLQKVHIGGDQLTRERFSGAKRLRADHQTDSDKFEHLSPITFELFHLMMNFLSMMFKQLYKVTSSRELGTLKSLQDRIRRTKVKEDVKLAYDADKDFLVSAVNAYICEAALEFFGMETVYENPKRHAPPADATEEELSVWFMEKCQLMVDENVLDTLEDKLLDQENSVEVEGHALTVTTTDGRLVQLFIRHHQHNSNSSDDNLDHVKNYGHLILELGLLFKDLTELIHLPDRKRGLRVLKLAMVYFKANNNLSKYAYEILRFLVHQECTLSERQAYESFYDLFVNTKGKVDSHIPADLQMEYIVKMTKRHIKHMFSNKNEGNVTNRSRAIAGMSEISDNFDHVTSVLIRSKKHADISADADELDMLEDLRQIRPFSVDPGRKHESFQRIPRSMVNYLNIPHFHDWISTKKYEFATELGN